MSDLGEVIGAVLAGLAHARRLADEETAAIAEYYRDNELLSGLAAPRLRLPEVTVDLPLLIDDHEAAREGEAESPTKVARLVLAELTTFAEARRLTLPRGFGPRLRQGLKKAYTQLPTRGRGLRTRYGLATEKVVGQVIAEDDFIERFPRSVRGDLVKLLAARARGEALKNPTRGPGLGVTVLTADVREGADPATVARLSIKLREEGLEWVVEEDDEGRRTSRLLPE